MAKRLQISLIPHQFRITFMRPDVVNVSSHRDDAFLQTLGAHRMLSEKPRTQLLPAVAVTAFTG